MSYGGHYGGGSNGRSHHDNTRDRDRENSRSERPDRPERNERNDRNDRSDRNYNGRYNSQRRYGQSSSYGDQSSNSSYRRPDGGRDFYGYRSGYNRSDVTERSQGNSTGMAGNPRHRDRNSQYDSYQGSKYRPFSGKPKGPSVSQTQNTELRASVNHVKSDSRSEGCSEDIVNDIIDDRRLSNRKQDWDSSKNAKQIGTQPRGAHNSREQYKPEYRPPIPPSHVNAVSDAVPAKVKSPSQAEALRVDKPDSYVPERQNSAEQEVSSSRRSSIASSKPLGITAASQSNVAPTTPKQERKRSPELSSKSSETPARVIDSGRENSDRAKPKEERLSRIFDDDSSTSKGSTKNASEQPPRHEKPSDVNLEDVSGSPSSNGFDTSVLSPVGSMASDDAFVQTLNIIPETKADDPGANNDESINLSEAETVVEDGSIDMAKSRSFLRKRGRDSFRDRVKRRNVVLSDDEDNFLDEATNSPPKDLASSARENEAGSSNEPNSGRNISAPVVGSDHREQSPSKGGPKIFERKSNGATSVSEDFKVEVPHQTSSLHKNSKTTYKIKRDSTGRSQLQRACKKGDVQEVKNLIEKGASANESDFGGFTCLHEAALAGHSDIVEYLIAKGADVNKQALEAGDYETPLMDAAENKHVSTVKILLKNGADPHICNNEGYSTITKLFHLQEDDEEYEDVIKVINDFAPPQVNSELSKVTHSPREIIDDPSESYFADLVKKKSKTLIYKYAAQGNKESAAEDFVTHAFSLSKMPDVLNLAARNGHVELVDILLGLNPGSFDINQVNKIGVTVLLATVGRGYYDVVKFLLSKGANPHIKRAEDGMTALEIAKHSAQYDPREVVILEESMNDDEDVKKQKDTTPVASAVSPSVIIESKKGQIDAYEEQEDVTGATVVPTKESKAPVKESSSPETKDDLDRSKELDVESEHPSDKEGSRGSSSPKRKMSHDDSYPYKIARKDRSAEEYSERSQKTSPKEENSEEVKTENNSPKPDAHFSPVDSTKSQAAASDLPSTTISLKAQEEQRLRAAEQAKIWQEKVQAKKKARKEMFLLAEKEKEKRRKEEEERRLESLKKQEEEQKERIQREEMEAKKLANELERKKQIMERQCIFQKYPIGLQEVVLSDSFKKEERLRYTPLYTFKVENECWVIDLQVSLILSISVPKVHSIVEGNLGPSIDVPSKDKLWSLFFKMIGVGKNNVIESNGLEKFRCLDLRYVRLAEIADWVKSENSEAYNVLWVENRLTEVDLDTLDTSQTKEKKREPNGSVHRSDIGFIPPRFLHREDVLRTIQTANSPLW